MNNNDRLKLAEEALDSGSYDRETIGHLFPELAESEDEKIRKALIQNLKERFGTKGTMGEGLDMPNVLAWLEKQGEQNPTKNIIETWKDMRLEVYQQASGNRHEPNCSDDNTKMFSLNDIDEIVEKMSEQKPTNKIEPKFKIDDWIVNKGNSYLIAYIDNEQRRYLFEIGGYTHESLNWEYIEDADKNYHLWTIEDAKDGDVLVASDDSIFLFKCIIDGTCKHYIALTTDGTIEFNEGLKQFWEVSTKVHPATKEQRDTLFASMKEAGYEWDEEKKELRKIKQILANSAKTCKDEYNPA